MSRARATDLPVVSADGAPWSSCVGAVYAACCSAERASARTRAVEACVLHFSVAATAQDRHSHAGHSMRLLGDTRLSAWLQLLPRIACISACSGVPCSCLTHRLRTRRASIKRFAEVVHLRATQGRLRRCLGRRGAQRVMFG